MKYVCVRLKANSSQKSLCRFVLLVLLLYSLVFSVDMQHETPEKHLTAIIPIRVHFWKQWSNFGTSSSSLAMDAHWHPMPASLSLYQLLQSNAELITSCSLSPYHSTILSTSSLCGCPFLLFPSINPKASVFNFPSSDIQHMCRRAVIFYQLPSAVDYECEIKQSGMSSGAGNGNINGSD